jgi:hypothetical protein
VSQFGSRTPSQRKGITYLLFITTGVQGCKIQILFLQFLKKLNRQERVVEEVRLALKPYYTSKRISKGDYKEILRKCVPKVSSPLLHRFLIS